MKIARIEHEGVPVTAVVEASAARLLPGVGVLDLLAVSAAERDALAGRATDEIALDGARLLSPILPDLDPRLLGLRAPRRGRGDAVRRARRDGSRGMGRAPGVLLLQPERAERPGGRDRGAARLRGARPRAGGRRDHRQAAAATSPSRTRAPTSSATRSSTTGRRATSQAASCGCRSASTRPRTSTTPSARGSSRRTSWNPTATATGSICRLQASINGAPLGEPDTLRSMAWSFEELARVQRPRRVDPGR